MRDKIEKLYNLSFQLIETPNGKSLTFALWFSNFRGTKRIKLKQGKDYVVVGKMVKLKSFIFAKGRGTYNEQLNSYN